MTRLTDINKNNLPDHIAIIMDGNGRWAKKQSKIRMFGHKVGIKAVKDTVEAGTELGLKYLTLYAFSSENWNRPKREIDALMELLVNTIIDETKTLIDNNIKLEANMGGITPAIFNFNGKWLDCPPYIFLPTCRLA